MSKEGAAGGDLVHAESSQPDLAALTAQLKDKQEHLRELEKEISDLSTDT